MAGLRVYVDYLSQPGRAVLLFVKANGIPHEVKVISITKGEQKSEEYRRDVHPFGKVPAIVDDGFRVFESVAILRYLARKYDVPEHWYPRDLKNQARVDEFLEWQHIGFRMQLTHYFHSKVVKPLLMGIHPDEKELAALKTRMEAALDDFERIWMRDGNYVVGDKISVADLLALCEIDELAATGYDATVGRPKTVAWMNRIRKELSPHYEEIVAPLRQFTEGTVSK